jgi:hypothetical protein
MFKLTTKLIKRLMQSIVLSVILQEIDYWDD